MANTEIFMKRLEYIFCSGSGNRFLLFDTLRNDLSGLNLARFAAKASDALQTDGILLFGSSTPFKMSVWNLSTICSYRGLVSR